MECMERTSVIVYADVVRIAEVGELDLRVSGTPEKLVRLTTMNVALSSAQCWNWTELMQQHSHTDPHRSQQNPDSH